ncbi:MAG TPA: nucleotidyl transferase AbiEii/AbiGii toxin family protein [Kineosporiaceae bacterium]|nr:nucleotidyl transferase AbiEii/AbiGii toxin family protein [Kineosporiaceae bacterium]
MHPFHERLARVGLAALSDYGFALAGGYAVQAHGLVSRPSEDVDLFTTMDAEATFPAAVAAAVTAYRQNGLTVEVLVDSPGFARLSVTDPEQHLSAKVELGIDWRQHSPTTLAIGPVLDQDDAVANKVNALYSRAQARDYIDVHAALASGRYAGPDLLRLATEHDPGFDPTVFADALQAIRRLPDAEFTAYGLTHDQIKTLVESLTNWAETITTTE